MSEIVERVATVLQEQALRNHITGLINEDAIFLARAAIAALRDPTEAMLAAAELLPKEQSTDSGIYSAMIDAALKETST